MVELLLTSCAICGLAIAAYFSLVYYHIIEADNRWIPSFCRMERGACMRILDTPEAKVLRVPNSIIGTLYYGAILFVPIHKFETWFLIASIFSVGLGMYLVHALIVRLKTHCPLCYTAHGINLVIANLFIVRAIQLRLIF
ncbi:MAG TPA: vitamin K epoxide reductase family protein [Bacteroidota bacterium]|nr:vitamin K epoxide reductase family protein [Bacteroidota bacterium]